VDQPLPQRVLTLPVLWRREVEDCALESPAEASSLVTDEEAFYLLKEQDKDALALLFAKYSKLVLKICYRVLRDFGEAEELTQNVFLHLYQRAEKFDASKGSGKAWIIQTAYHRALDRREYLSHRQFYVGTDLTALADTLSGGNNVEREVGSKLDREHLVKALAELPEKQRRTIELFFFEGLDLHEICERLEDSLINVRHHYYRGLDKLRKNTIVRHLWGRKL
jgi:RNA polymerase sigma-70 factor (ECF subfamily)